jgi:hypothetical protein
MAGTLSAFISSHESIHKSMIFATLHQIDIALFALYVIFYIAGVYVYELIVDGHDQMFDWIHYSVNILRKSMSYWTTLILQTLGIYCLALIIIMTLLPTVMVPFGISFILSSGTIILYVLMPFFMARGYLLGCKLLAEEQISSAQETPFAFSTDQQKRNTNNLKQDLYATHSQRAKKYIDPFDEDTDDDY